jgi:prevent-host-death family protein
MTMAKKREPAKSRVGAAEFKARCLELIDHVRESRIEYVVTRHGEPVAQLVPIDAPAPASPLGVMRGTVLRYDGPFDPIPAVWSLDQKDGDED